MHDRSLRSRSHDALPRVGFEPTRKRFLRPWPLPVGLLNRLSVADRLHRVGLEPISLRLKVRGSAELSYACVSCHSEHHPQPRMRRGCGEYPVDKSVSPLNTTILLHNALGRIRTFNLRFRRPELSPVELPVRGQRAAARRQVATDIIMRHHAPWSSRLSDLPVIGRVLCL